MPHPEGDVIRPTAAGRQTIHRAGLADITVNGKDWIQVIEAGKPVTVGVSIVAGAETGSLSTIYVIAQGSTGYKSLTLVKSGKTTKLAWVSGIKAWYTKYPLADMPATNVLTTTTLAANEVPYTYWRWSLRPTARSLPPACRC